MLGLRAGARPVRERARVRGATVRSTGGTDSLAVCAGERDWWRTADDRALVGRARDEPDAFAELFRRHHRRIYGFAYRRSGSHEVAEEVTAATFEQAWKGLGAFRWRGGGFEPWLFRIASAELAGWYRRRGRDDTPRAQMALRELSASRAMGESVEASDGDDVVRAALDRLHPRYQRVLALRFLAGLTTEETAAAMQCSRPALAVLVHRALASLRRQLAAPEDVG